MPAKTRAKTVDPTTEPEKFASTNQVLLVGRLTAAPTVRTTTAGPVASLRLATNDTKVTEYHDVVLWGESGEQIAGAFTKGSPVMVTGRLRTRSWTGRDGSSRRTTEIVAKTVEAYTGQG